jgi:hypothetical protein
MTNRRDAGMVEGGEELGLTVEAREPIRIVREGGVQHLDRHLAFEPAVARLVHLAHAASAERRRDFVGSQQRAGGKRHGSRPILMTGTGAS